MPADVTLIIEALDKTQGTFNAISAGAAIALGGAVKVAVDFDTAMSSASRALDLSTKEAAAFANQAKEIAPALGLAPTKFAELSAEAGKLGVAKNDIVGFAKNIAELGLITDSTDTQVMELASSFAAIKTITGATNKELEIAGAAFNALDDKIGGNVRGITEFTRQTAAAGKLLGLSIGDLGAYGATFGAIGVKEAVAYRSFNSLITKLAAPQVLSKQGKAGLETLGIATDDLAKRMTTNANGGIDFFLGRIRDLAKTDVSAALGAVKQVVGADFGDEILTLALAGNKYKEALAIVGDASGNAAKKQEELAKKAASVKGQMAIASATAQVLGINLGAALLPALVGILQAITPLVKGFSDLVVANPILGQLTVGALLLLAAIAPIVGLITGISGAFATLSGLAAAIGGIGLAAPFVAGVAAALPFLAIVALVTGGAALIVTYWQPISAFFTGLWGGVVSTTNFALSALTGGVSSTLSALTPILQLGAIPFLLFANAAAFGVTKTVEVFTYMYGAIAPIVGGFVGMIAAGTLEVWNNFLGLLTNINEGFVAPILGLAGTVYQGAYAIGAGIYQGVAQAAQPLFGFVGEISNYIGASLQNLAGAAYGWGASIINQLTSGINASFQGLVGNLQAQLAHLRSFLPSSDAERGALSDLSSSGAKLWETFGAGMNAGLPTATQAIAQGTSQLLPTPDVASRNSGSVAGGQSIVINFSPSVNGNTTPDLIEALRVESRRLLEMLQTEGDRLGRGNL